MEQENNLLSRLCLYSFNKQKLSQENFLTEVMAYLFEEDGVFRKVFLKTIIKDGGRRRRFYSATAATQVPFPRCFVDLVLYPAKGKPILVEVKIKATETQTSIYGSGHVPQIKKYIKLGRGHVAYLASIQAPDADVRAQDRFLGRSYIEKLHQKLEQTENFNKLSSMGRQFVGFLKEQGMAYGKPFTKNELKISKEAFTFAAKAQEHLAEVVSEHQGGFRRALKLKAKAIFSRATFNANNGSAYTYLKGFRKWPFVSAGFGIEPGECETSFTVWFCVRREMEAERVVRKAGFSHDAKSSSRYWYEDILLKGGASDMARIRKCVKTAIKKIKRII